MTINEQLELDKGYYQLGCAIVYQAMKDYLYDGPKYTITTLKRKRERILKELDTKYMDLISGGFAKKAKYALLHYPERVRKQLLLDEEDYE